MTTEPSEPPVDSVAPARAPKGQGSRQKKAGEQLDAIAESVAEDFSRGRRVLSFFEYLDLFAENPARYGRDASQYVHDMFAHFGTERIQRPWGKVTEFKLFGAPWAQPGAEEPQLIGHQELQMEIYRVLRNFAREGRSNRLMLMHGPNGSAKSTAARCMHRALELYSEADEGALYRFHWIFPTRKTSRGSIGFGTQDPTEEYDTFAHLADRDIDARLVMELRDHPLFLIPLDERRRLLDQMWEEAELETPPSRWLYDGQLSHKNKQIFEALLAEYGGKLRDVLRHVQIERYFVSRRYRTGSVTLGPEMSVDAGERQVTADRSLAALPTSLQAITLFEAHGELVEAAGGILEFSDLLKRPLDTFRYLQITLETGEASLNQQTIFTNCVMLASANEVHMAAFREHPEYASFRGRLELMRVPYLRSVADEQRIYDTQIVPQLGAHVAPHCTRLAAEFAILTRMRRPEPSRFEGSLKEIVEGLTAVEKMDLFDDGTPPARLSSDERKILRANIGALYRETQSQADYEGRVGISPRTVRTLLLDAAQSDEYQCVSPFAVLKELDELCSRENEFDWLELKPLGGHFHDHAHFREIIRERVLDRIESDMRRASGLVDDQQYEDLFRRYVSHVSAYVKGEKLRNQVTGKDEPADESLMREVEELLSVAEGNADEHRNGVISGIAAWAIDNPGEDPVIEHIFPKKLEQMRLAAFKERRKPLANLLRSLLSLIRGEDGSNSASEHKAAVAMLAELESKLGYERSSASDGASALLRERYSDLVG